jgi:hypothetical protein
MPDARKSQPPTLLDAVRQVLRLRHDSMHTERSSVTGSKRFARFHGRRSRADLFPDAPKIEAFLTDLAVHGQVAAATQHRAMDALMFLSALLRHPPAATRHRHPHHSATARAPRCGGTHRSGPWDGLQPLT